MKVWDKGPWYVNFAQRGLIIDSEDFTHDASLIVHGDFGNREERLKYAKWLADRLNRKEEKG